MKPLTNFLYETGQLKRVQRSGWWLLGIKNSETVAEHCHRAAVIGYFLAKEEKVNAEKVVLMCLFNDIHETRLNDLHKVGHRYIDFKQAENKVLQEQLQTLDPSLFSIMQEFQQRKTPEANITRDADLLENAFQAREYLKQGFTDAQNWLDNIRSLLHSASAKALMKSLEQTDPDDWWKGLKKTER